MAEELLLVALCWIKMVAGLKKDFDVEMIALELMVMESEEWEMRKWMARCS